MRFLEKIISGFLYFLFINRRKSAILLFLLIITIPVFSFRWVRIENDTSFYMSFYEYNSSSADNQTEFLMPPGASVKLLWYSVSTLEELSSKILNGNFFVKREHLYYKMPVKDVLGAKEAFLISLLKKQYEDQVNKGYHDFIVSLSSLLPVDTDIGKSFVKKKIVSQVTKEKIVLWFDSPYNAEFDSEFIRWSYQVFGPYEAISIPGSFTTTGVIHIRMLKIRSNGLLLFYRIMSDWNLSIDALQGDMYTLDMTVLLASSCKELVRTNEGERWIVLRLGSYLSSSERE